MELYKIDTSINNCWPFCASQNYSHEIIRQNKGLDMIKILKNDGDYSKLLYTDDLVLQNAVQRIIRDLSPQTSEVQINNI